MDIRTFQRRGKLLRVSQRQNTGTVERGPLLRSSRQSVRGSISNQVSAVVHLYEQNADILDLLTVTERSATGPSVSDMMGWLHDAERHFRQQFPRRKTVLQTLRPDDLSLLESAPKRWTALECPSAGDHIRVCPLHGIRCFL
ncbi:AFG2-interacting ribosome maturation factor-like [Pseudochaenichthys georgianus]|uniref:AFG2-interacting ribosome maturation factor-like n=1 Tax=Pseudochaenichthys georgianus TaxID=52239 RepID=UPI0039C0F114